MNSRKSHPSTMSALALRRFVLGIVDHLQEGPLPQKPWASREEGIILIEEVMLEGRSCGFESAEGFRELCCAVLQFRIGLPFSMPVRQVLMRSGMSELQRVEELRLAVINNSNNETPISRLERISCN